MRVRLQLLAPTCWLYTKPETCPGRWRHGSGREWPPAPYRRLFSAKVDVFSSELHSPMRRLLPSELQDRCGAVLRVGLQVQAPAEVFAQARYQLQSDA